MSKRKRGSKTPPPGGDQPTGDEITTSTADDAPKEDMAHVSRNLLSGSPDIFAPKWSEEPPAPAPEVVAGPPAADAAAEAPETAEPPAEPPPALAPPPSAPTPHYVAATVTPERPRRPGSSMALGIVLVVVGLFALGVVVFGVDLTQYGWPLFVIIPGLPLLVVGFLGGGAGASVPGGTVTTPGLALPYPTSASASPTWPFASPLVPPGG